MLLPLECFFPFIGNICRTGSIGVADPETLQWRYYVKLDPAFIDKAMWAEVSPNGKLLWTSSGSGHDLLAYDMDEITAANAAPDGPLLKPVIVRLINAVPPNGITGATFFKHRLLVASAERDAVPGLVDRPRRRLAHGSRSRSRSWASRRGSTS